MVSWRTPGSSLRLTFTTGHATVSALTGDRVCCPSPFKAHQPARRPKLHKSTHSYCALFTSRNGISLISRPQLLHPGLRLNSEPMCPNYLISSEHIPEAKSLYESREPHHPWHKDLGSIGCMMSQLSEKLHINFDILCASLTPAWSCHVSTDLGQHWLR